MTATCGDRWNAEGPADDEMSDRWRRIVSATHLPWSVRLSADGPNPGFSASVQRWWIDDMALVDVDCTGPMRGTRQRRQLADTDGEFLVVLFILAGTETVWQDDGDAGLGPGDAVIWNSTRRARFRVPGHLRKRSLLIPRAALEEVSGRAWTAPGLTLDGGAPTVRLLSHYLDVLTAMLPALGPAGVVAARNATLDLVVGATRSDARQSPVSTAADPVLRATIERYIDRHLAGPVISPAALARAHGVSVRTINRIFSSTGETVANVIRLRRLARARMDLATTEEPIAAIAHRLGFFDGSHFSRTFKARYGMSPQEFRAASAAGLDAPVGPAS